MFSLGKAETGKLSGVKISSNSSPQISYSRSSGRLSFEDNFDDSEFSGPFVVDDDVITDPGSRYVGHTLLESGLFTCATLLA